MQSNNILYSLKHVCEVISDNNFIISVVLL